jgi:hypothetical protein
MKVIYENQQEQIEFLRECLDDRNKHIKYLENLSVIDKTLYFFLGCTIPSIFFFFLLVLL